MKGSTLKLRIYGALSILTMIVIFCLSAQNATSSAKLSNSFTDKIKGNVAETIMPKIEVTLPSAKDGGEEKAHKAFNLTFGYRKWAHVYCYGALGLFVGLTATELYKLKKIKHTVNAFLASMGVCFAYACTDEFHQRFVKGRNGNFKDVLFDTIGYGTSILLVFAVCMIIFLLKERKKKQ